jgi:IstB-like ATP binding protein
MVSHRYERGSIIITSNQSLGACGEVFGDAVIAIDISGDWERIDAPPVARTWRRQGGSGRWGL